MKNFFVCFALTFFSLGLNESFSASWCKAIYPFSKEASDGNFQKQLSLCKNTDNVFISIHSQYDNALHLLHASIANFCDLTKEIIKSESTTHNDSFYSAVCVFKRHNIRKNKYKD